MDDVFIIWSHDLATFSVFLDMFNTHEPPIKFKSSLSISSLDYLDTSVFKYPDNSKTLLTEVFFKPTDTHDLQSKHSFHSRNTFECTFFRICSKNKEFENAWSVLFQCLRKRNYLKRWMPDIKSKTVTEPLMNQYQANAAIPTTSRWGSKPCGIDRYMTCKGICYCSI